MTKDVPARIRCKDHAIAHGLIWNILLYMFQSKITGFWVFEKCQVIAVIYTPTITITSDRACDFHIVDGDGIAGMDMRAYEHQ